LKYLIFGLGNPGPEYSETRHNIGFQVLDQMAEKAGLSFETSRHADITEMRTKGRQLLLLKPNTFMNRSGKAVHYWMQEEKVPEDRIIIVTDDVALPFGKLRLRAKGGPGGHNGLGHIIESIGTSHFPRLRFGVGNDYPKGKQVEYVLGHWDTEQKDALPERLAKAGEILRQIPFLGLKRTMSEYNNS
jgi:PTH1 family peptidyl-tRNA hydrolase